MSLAAAGASRPGLETAARAETTLFLVMSVDGKITSGDSDDLDSDRDWKRLAGVKEGLPQYYHIEQSLAVASLNTGRVMAKIGVNTRTAAPRKQEALTFFIIDRRPHLTEAGVSYLARWVGKLYVVTNNAAHPAFGLRSTHHNLEVIHYGDIDLSDLLTRVRRDYGIEHLVIQSGGTLNTALVRQKLIDHVLIVVAPLLVGGQATSSLMDGQSLRTEADLVDLKALKLVKCEVLEHSYLRLDYDVIQETVITPPQV
jgi:2,5-diamino-6-(ribosylamino)-4(3H)-pyrimidinone 5'-phosphate reductase